MKKYLRCAFFVALGGLSIAAFGAPPRYLVSSLAAPCNIYGVVDINNFGTVIGSQSSNAVVCMAEAPNVIPAVYLTKINKFNTSAAIEGLGVTSPKAAVYRKGLIVNLPTPRDVYQSYAWGINDRGVLVGSAIYGFPPNDVVHATAWVNGKFFDLHGLGTGSSAYAINNAGQVVGYAILPDAPWGVASLWAGGVQTILGSITGTKPGYSSAIDINDRGQVIGNSSIYGQSVQKPWMWKSGVMRDLTTYPGSEDFAYAYAINNNSAIVGYMAGRKGRVGALWKDGRAYDLNDLIDPSNPYYGSAALDYAVGINDAGQIVGQFRVQSGQGPMAYLLTPVD